MRRLKGPALAGLFVFGAMSIFQSAAALAQSAEHIRNCERAATACRDACAAECGLLDFQCRAQCGAGVCRDEYEQCLEGGQTPKSAPTPRLRPGGRTDGGEDDFLKRPTDKPALQERQRKEKAAPRSRSIAPTGAPPPAPAAPPAAADRVHSMEVPEAAEGGALNGRILFLNSRDEEPSAEFYGYLLLGRNLSEARKLSVAEAIACRLEALPDAAAAAAVERLGLFSLPALRDAGATRVTAQDVLTAYDFDRAELWLRAAGNATGQDFTSDNAIVFVASRVARAMQMDQAKLPGSNDGLDPVVADASRLSATFAGAWVGQIVDGLESGEVKSRQELQSLMEATSWLDWANQPLLSLFRVQPKPGEAAPEACPT